MLNTGIGTGDWRHWPWMGSRGESRGKLLSQQSNPGVLCVTLAGLVYLGAEFWLSLQAYEHGALLPWCTAGAERFLPKHTPERGIPGLRAKPPWSSWSTPKRSHSRTEMGIGWGIGRGSEWDRHERGIGRGSSGDWN